MTEPTTEVVRPKSPIQMHPVGSSAAFELLLVFISAVVVSSARSISPVVLKVQDVDGVDGLYGTSGAEYFWTAVGAVIGLAGAAFIAVAAIANGIQLGRR
jgi:hypothetical protein